jgi:hypothetical protein
VVASGDLKHSEYPDEYVRCETGEGQLPSYVFNRDGQIVLKSSATGTHEEWAAAVLALTGETLPDPDSMPRRAMVGNFTNSSDPKIDGARQWPSPDGQAVLVSFAHALRLYRVPKEK